MNTISPVDEDHLSKKTKLIRENFFPREPPVFKGEVFEGEYQDLLDLLEWEQTSTGSLSLLPRRVRADELFAFECAKTMYVLVW